MNKKIIATFALAAAVITAGKANTITPDFVVLAPGTVTYMAALSSGEAHRGDGFTIYDIGGYMGLSFVVAPIGWTATDSFYGSPFADGVATLTTPDTGAVNVHFTYQGPSVENSSYPPFTFGTPFAPFIIGTTADTTVTDSWMSRDHLLGTSGVIDGGRATSVSHSILVPAGVPDGGSTMILLGSALSALAFWRRKALA